MVKIEKRLNIFIDESGDFGFSEGSSKLFAISFVLHESEKSIKNELEYLNNQLTKLNYLGMIHLAYLVAKRGEYEQFSFERRRKIFWSIFYFTKRVNIKIHTIILDKKYMNERQQQIILLTQKIEKWMQNIKAYLDSFDRIVVYYDNGQDNIVAILNEIFSNIPNVEKRTEFNHTEKRLFQVADMLTVIDKIIYKHRHKIPLTKAELHFFNVKDILNIIRYLKNKRMQ